MTSEAVCLPGMCLVKKVFTELATQTKRAGDVPGTAVAMCAYTSSPSRGYLSLYPTLREAQRALSVRSRTIAANLDVW